MAILDNYVFRQQDPLTLTLSTRLSCLYSEHTIKYGNYITQ